MNMNVVTIYINTSHPRGISSLPKNTRSLHDFTYIPFFFFVRHLWLQAKYNNSHIPMEAKSIATSLGGDRLFIFPTSHRSFSRLPLKSACCIGGAASDSGVNSYRGLTLTRRNPIVSTRLLVPVRAIDSDSDLPHENQQVRFTNI